MSTTLLHPAWTDSLPELECEDYDDCSEDYEEDVSEFDHLELLTAVQVHIGYFITPFGNR